MDKNPTATRAASDMIGWLRRYGRWLLLLLGVAAVVILLRYVGVDGVVSALKKAGPWLPAILLLEALWVTGDMAALRQLIGPHAGRVSKRLWLRSMMAHYVVLIVLPAGRAGAEVTRAAMLAPSLGGPRATAGAALLQSVILIANCLMSLLCLAAASSAAGVSSPLAWLLVVNACGTGVLGIALYLGCRRVRIGGFLGRRIRRMSTHGPELDAILRERPQFPWIPLLTCVAARLVQVFQYGVILWAIGGEFTVLNAFLSEGIHLVGAGFGDLVPNQVGITEGAYAFFGHLLEISAPSAISIALIARLVQYTLVVLYALIGAFSGQEQSPVAPEPGSRPAAP